MLYKNGLEYLKVIVDGISAWMNSKGFEKIDHIQGQMNYNQLINPFYFETGTIIEKFWELIN